MKVTIKDIAAASGVSFQTVSHVLKGNYNKVSAEKKELILQKADELNYYPNIAARGLRRRQSFLIGVLFPSINNRLYSEMLINIQQLLLAHGYAGIYAFWKNNDEVKTAYDMVLKRNVDGILTAHNDPSLFPKGIPLVNYGRKFAGFDCVRMDKEDIAEKTAAYLNGLGHRKIGFINGARLAVPECFNDFDVRPEWCVLSNGDYHSGYEGMLSIMSAKELPSVIVAHNDISAIGAMTAARENSLKVPDDISIIGKDDIEEAQFIYPSLSTFGPEGEMNRSELLVNALMERMASDSLPGRDIVLKGQLIVRKSCIKLK